MAAIGFYHLTRTALEEALAPLLGRTLAAGERAVILCPSSDQVAALDKALWAVKEPNWLPHGSAADGDAELQPIWLSTDTAAPNGARFLFVVGGALTDRLGAFERVFDLFDGNDADAVAAARERWKSARQEGHDLTYWQQGPRGWEKQA
ncbi:MAG TPA: DNA polymerase III subunit chi [Acetobacteraceae bacterium]|nr:DNA polymerase III subunit chi [Acetobacteraceae bacterium]